MNFLKILVINCLICLVVMSIAWTSSGIVIGIACTYIPAVADLFKLSLERKYMLDNGDLIGFAIDGIIETISIMFFPYALLLTLSLKGKIAFSQTLAKSQRGREFVEWIKSLDTSLSNALQNLFKDKSGKDL